ncbi:hypothetical protein [Tardiphaga sp.]|uniref:hypothetical protein n=1 Tax=Tardiphaga sp. TaxID=1926292 RepID=UPI002603AB48|nr:hypothetical protein [Tardiphaga sp.]MDB5616595.1 hypothetical protein [Tardiphaga sp.]
MSKLELISTRVEPELAARVKSEADRDRRTVSSFVKIVLADALAARLAAAEKERASA